MRCEVWGLLLKRPWWRWRCVGKILFILLCYLLWPPSLIYDKNIEREYINIKFQTLHFLFLIQKIVEYLATGHCWLWLRVDVMRKYEYEAWMMTVGTVLLLYPSDVHCHWRLTGPKSLHLLNSFALSLSYINKTYIGNLKIMKQQN